MKENLPKSTFSSDPSSPKAPWMFPDLPKRGEKRYNVDINDEDSEGVSKIVVRMVVVLILIHIVVIGGVWLRGSLQQDEIGSVIPNPGAVATSTPAPETPAPQPAAPTPVQEPVAPASAPVTNIPVAAEVADAPAPAIASAPVAVEPTPVATDPIPLAADPEADDETAGLPAGPVRHIVATGDTWETIARDNGCTVQALHLANPNATLASGSSLLIPTKGSDPTKLANATPTRPATPVGEVYILKKGETLSKVARMHKVSVQALQKYNNFSDNDLRRLKPGTQIRIPKKK